MNDRYGTFPDLLFYRPKPFVLRITINKPEQTNAVDPALHKQLEEAWRAIDEDPKRAVR